MDAQREAARREAERRQRTESNYTTTFYGAVADLHSYRGDKDVALVGPAGTGKSFGALYLINKLCQENAGLRVLIARKTRTSLSNTGLVTFERNVLGLKHPLVVNGPQRRNRQVYSYSNGSEIDIGGLDPNHIGKILSAEYDIVLIIQAEEITESDYETLTTRLRSGVLPCQFIILDVNPASKNHWIKKRIDEGKLVHLQSTHKDNPQLWNSLLNDWTERGKRYIERLMQLTGVRLKRLGLGIWASAEGAVYPDYDANVHLIDRFEIPASWPRIISIDFGYTNPLCVQWWALSPDGRMFRYREIYQTQRLVEDVSPEIISLSNGENIIAVVCDWDAEDRATLVKHGINNVKAIKHIRLGIEAVAMRLRSDGSNVQYNCRLYLMRDSLISADERLVDDHKPTCTEEEIEGYEWPKDDNSGKLVKEVPIDRDNHGCDAMRYAVAFVDNIGNELEERQALVVHDEEYSISPY